MLCMSMTKPKRPRDTNQLAKHIVDLSTGEAEEEDPYKGKNLAAVERGLYKKRISN